MIKHILKLIWNKKGNNALMILEIFLSFLVLFFVLAYVFFNLEKTNAPLGFATQDRWMVGIDRLEQLDSLDAANVIENMRNNLLSLEEVEAVSFTDNPSPFKSNQWRNGTEKNGFQLNALMVVSDTELAKTMDLNLLKGRWFDEGDLTAAIPPVVVNQRFIDKYYPEKNMIDSIFLFEDPMKIIGIIEDYKYMGEFTDPQSTVMMLRPYTENHAYALLKMRPGTPTSFEEKLSSIVNASTKTTGNIIENVEKERIADSRESWILFIALLSICGFLCVNVALGLFGVLWYNINKRKSEIGLRQALGASGFDISKQFILEIVFLTVVALLIGIFFAIQIPLLKVTEYPNEMFYKAIVYASLIILSLVFLCALFPSIQAAKITPANSLHED